MAKSHHVKVSISSLEEIATAIRSAAAPRIVVDARQVVQQAESALARTERELAEATTRLDRASRNPDDPAFDREVMAGTVDERKARFALPARREAIEKAKVALARAEATAKEDVVATANGLRDCLQEIAEAVAPVLAALVEAERTIDIETRKAVPSHGGVRPVLWPEPLNAQILQAIELEQETRRLVAAANTASAAAAPGLRDFGAPSRSPGERQASLRRDAAAGVQAPGDRRIEPPTPGMETRRQPANVAPRSTTLGPRQVELPPLSVRAALNSADPDRRTVNVIFTTGAPVERMDWGAGQRYLEVLSLDPGHVRLDRMNAGAPLLNSHSAYSVDDILGIVEEGSAKVRAGQGLATVRFSKRADVEPVWRDVLDGVVRSVSVGYRVHKMVEAPGRDGQLPTRTAVDWEPFEVSLVPMPADPGAQVRNGNELQFEPCEIVRAMTDDERRERLERAKREFA
jgi:hypothetical protein